MIWLSEDYRIINSDDYLYPKSGYIYNVNEIYQYLNKYMETNTLFCAIGDHEGLDIGHLIPQGLVVKLEKQGGIFSFTLKELKPKLFNTLNLNPEGYEADVIIEGSLENNIVNIKNINNIIAITRKYIDD